MTTTVDPSGLVPITVLTGYLGAGKTTLLRTLLRRPGLQRTAVVVNELGEIGLDHELLEQAGETLLQLEGGCLCCTVRADLARALDRLWRERARGRGEFDRVVIETTGLADPAPVLHTLMVDPVVVARYRLDGIVTVVDAVNGADTLDRSIEAVKQVAMADRLVVSKVDLAEPAALRALEGRLAALAPTASLLRAEHGRIEPSAILECGPWDARGRRPEVERWLGEIAAADVEQGSDPSACDGPSGDEGTGRAGRGRHRHDHVHDHEDRAHGLGRARHEAAITSFCLRRSEPLSATAASLLLTLLSTLAGPRLLRVKGLLAIREEPQRPLVVHAVQHLVHEPVELDGWPSADRTTRLVFVTRDLPRSVVEELWDTVEARDREGAWGSPPLSA